LSQDYQEPYLFLVSILAFHVAMNHTVDERMASFIVGSNYQPLDVIGEGAYGVVWSVLTSRLHEPTLIVS
jgi:hypothetical protein